MLVVFVLLAIIFSIASHGIFFTPRNVSLLLRQASVVAILAAGVSFLIIMGEIDLSIGSAVYLCSAIAASLQVMLGFGTFPVLLLTIGAGMIMGAWQGFWVVRIAVPSFVVTLAGLLAFRGIGYYATDASTISPVTDSFSALSEAFIPIGPSYAVLAACYIATVAFTLYNRSVRTGLLGAAAKVVGLTAVFALLAWAFGGFRGIPAALLWVAGTGVLLWILMSRTKYGRNAYLIGSNREAATLAGIPLKAQLFFGFVLMGVFYGVAGVLITARLGSSSPTTGNYLELDAIAAAVIGGTSLRGGIGTVSGAILGAILLTTIDNGMSILNVSSFIQLVIKGMVLLCALAFDSYMVKRRT
jgi:D-xylose transport system permease protein